MKKLIITIICISIMITYVSAINFPRNETEQQWEDIIGILNDTIITKSMQDQLSSLIPEIDDDDVQMDSGYGPGYKYYERRHDNRKVYYEYLDADSCGVGIRREWTIFSHNNEIQTSSYHDFIRIDKAAFDYLPDKFDAFIEAMRYMERIEQGVSGYWSSDGSYHENMGEFEFPGSDYYEENGYINLYEDWDGDAYFYQNDYTGSWLMNELESTYVRDVYMVKPDQIKIFYKFGIYDLKGAQKLDDPYLGCNSYYIDLNYAPPEDDPEAEYSKYELDNIDISLIYSYYAGTTPAEGNSTAPQTGFATVAYAAVAVVSAATAFTLVKKRRG